MVYTVSQVGTMSQADLIKAAAELKIETRNLSTTALRAKIQESVFTKNGDKKTNNDDYMSSLEQKYAMSKVKLGTATENKHKYENIFEDAKSKYSNDPTKLGRAKDDFQNAKDSYRMADIENSQYNLELFIEQTRPRYIQP